MAVTVAAPREGGSTGAFLHGRARANPRMHCMKLTDKLSLWGTTHAAARDAERAAAQGSGERREELRLEAQRLREQADSLHREVYRELGPRSSREKASA